MLVPSLRIFFLRRSSGDHVFQGKVLRSNNAEKFRTIGLAQCSYVLVDQCYVLVMPPAIPFPVWLNAAVCTAQLAKGLL